MQSIKKILVTGGAGYIGSVLTPKLLQAGYEVTVYDSFIYTDMGIRNILKDPGLTVVHDDIRNYKNLTYVLSGMDCVIHLAAISNDPSSELDLALTKQVNLDVFPTLLQEAKKAGVQRFINPSSIGVYGVNFNNNVTEEIPVNPLTEYARCKVKSEQLVNQYSSNEFTTVTLRCGTVCGWSPRMRFDLSVNTLTAVALHNKELTVWGGDQMRPQIHIDDITDFFVQLVAISAEKINGKTYNAGGHNTSILQIAETIREVLHDAITLNNAAPRDDERSYHVNSEKIARELQLVPKRTVKDAVTGIVDAYNTKLWTDYTDPLYNNVQRMKHLNLA